MTRKVIKDTKYCQILSQGKISLMKNRPIVLKIHIPRSLDVTEEQLLQLIKESITTGVFSK